MAIELNDDIMIGRQNKDDENAIPFCDNIFVPILFLFWYSVEPLDFS
uniref:Uncharacterized protein n=1 Tax=Tetranychus urticae TaxID=32264 RepID=T1KLC9_TETUR